MTKLKLILNKFRLKRHAYQRACENKSIDKKWSPLLCQYGQLPFFRAYMQRHTKERIQGRLKKSDILK